MSANPFVVNPIKLHIYDPITSLPRKTFVFLGDLPKHIYTAITKRDDKSLREFYGADFRTKLAFERRGGSDVDLSDIEALLAGAKKPAAAPAQSSLIFTPGVEYIRDVFLYPEDKMSEIKDKIFAITNIPTYRQHLFYPSGDMYKTVYKLWARGVYDTQIDKISSPDAIFGLPIDKNLYDMRDDIKVEADDMFMILATTLTTEYTIYVVDLAQFIAPVRNQILGILGDKYTVELLYYGFIVKFWPQLTRECFTDYITDEGDMINKYPDLAKQRDNVRYAIDVESELINFDYRNAPKALAWAKNGEITIAITQMTAVITGAPVLLNIRNLFDKLRASKCVPEIQAYITIDNKKYMLRKKHIKVSSEIQFPSGIGMKNGLTMAISLRKADQQSFHVRSATSTIENEQSRYLFLNIWPDGRYFVKTFWNEEDEYQFEDVIKIMKKFIDPIIGSINSLGRYIFINGVSLPYISKHNIQYRGLNVCLFWKKVVVESTFKYVKTMWEPYLRSRIIGARNIQQFDKYEFMFRKGIHKFDKGAIEKIVTASSNMILTNYYSHLSNSLVKQKWDQNYDGRIVRMSHRTTSIKFEVIDIREAEFMLFYRYIVMFVYRAIIDPKINEMINKRLTYTNVKKLKKLREEDPELYNLKKHGSNKVYSILCQNQRQPMIYTEDELRGLSERETRRLTRYWNFTLNKPAFYGCPNPKFPHLSFTVDEHPKHYCLPCCSKESNAEESKKRRVAAECLAKHIHPSDSGISLSRHIVAYTKEVDLGRLAKFPETNIKMLLQETVTGDLSYHIYGVQQMINQIPAGIIFSIVAALNTTVEKLMYEIIKQLKNNPDLFNTLSAGVLSEYFASMADLTVVIKDYFIDRKLISVELRKFTDWSELFIEILHLLFDVSVFMFIDDAGTGQNVDLYVQGGLRDEITHHVMETNHNIIIIKKHDNYYPIVLVSVERYVRTLEISQRTYELTHPVIELFGKMIAYSNNQLSVKINKNHDLGIMMDFIKTSNYVVKIKYINRQNLCYAIGVRDQANNGDITTGISSNSNSNKLIYIPVEYSVHVTDGIPITFTPPERDELDTYSATMQFCAKFNEYIEKNHKSEKLYYYLPIIPTAYVKYLTNGVYAFKSNFIYHFAPIELGELPPLETVAVMKYDYLDINRRIMQRMEPAADNRVKQLGESLYNNYLYQLLLLEFVSYLDRERNTELRSQIKQLIMKADFKAGVADFARRLRDLLRPYPTDFVSIQNTLSEFYYSKLNIDEIMIILDKTTYDFDRLTINQLRGRPYAEVRAALARIVGDITKYNASLDTTKLNFPNIYLPCGEATSDYCADRKLIVNRDINELIDILTADIINPLKSKYLLTSLFNDNVINFMQFERVPSEIITIYYLIE